ncbi:MAG: tRNA (guanosine(37)-N1)-methyltransferase TrmD [Bacteroidales bacterium]|nr:tRNA (guanosine(37)-N1)-methyltransferase TrmD [Bacteroidales bacterium]
MRIDILTLFPNMMSMFFEESIVKRAQKKGVVEVHFHDLHEWSLTRYGSVDDYPYGGGAGMVMAIEPLANCIESLTAQRHYDDIIYTAPDGEMLSQPMANTLSLKENLMILCGHYKGIDERLREHFVTREISIGDYVLTGGELAAAVICDAVIRLIPTVIGDEQSALSDSFQDGLVAPPEYTRPPEFRGWKVPDVLLSGNHAKIAEWRYQQSLERTRQRRPDLYDKYSIITFDKPEETEPILPNPDPDIPCCLYGPPETLFRPHQYDDENLSFNPADNNNE